MKRGLIAGLIGIFLSSAASAGSDLPWPAPPCPVVAPAIADARSASGSDASALLRLATIDDGTAETLLTQAEAASLLLRDKAALDRARRYLESPDSIRARDAWTLIGAVQLRRGHYRDAADAIERALGLPATAPDQSGDNAETLRKTLQIARALAEEPPPLSPEVADGDLPVAPDLAGLIRGKVDINGQPVEAVLDTGAGLSVVIQSLVEPLGLRLLDREVSVASPVSAATPARLAVAHRFAIGGTEHRNVVFLVMPDEALTFAEGAYRIEAIIGFPVLSRLGRLHFLPLGESKVLRFNRTADQQIAHEVNLVIDGSTPKVLACTDTPPRPLQLALDSGASETSLLGRYRKDFPEALQEARPVTQSVGGAGGTIEQDNLLLAQIAFDLGSRRIVLNDVSLGDEALDQSQDHGRLGQDVLRDGYILDFQTMQFGLGSSSGPFSSDPP